MLNERLRTTIGLALAAFTAYFSMYAFRKPFAAATYADMQCFGFDFKSVLVISQLLGYLLSKFIGIRLVSGLKPERRPMFLLCMIGIALFALLLFAIVPLDFKFLALFLNGIPLGMVFGVVFSYLEGRRLTEMISLGLGASIIFASGTVKSVGLYLMNNQSISTSWMPFATGLLFLPVYVISVWFLHRLPAPDEKDKALKKERLPMTAADRRVFFRNHAFSIVLLIIAYVLLTAFRDIRDNFMVETWIALGYKDFSSHLVTTELYISISVVVSLTLLSLVKRNELAYQIMLGLIVLGAVLLGVSTLAYHTQMISGYVWIVLNGFGLFLSYTLYQGLLFDRVIATLGGHANVGFLMYLADSFGYLGSFAVLSYKMTNNNLQNWLDFYSTVIYFCAILISVMVIAVAIRFSNRTENKSLSTI